MKPTLIILGTVAFLILLACAGLLRAVIEFPFTLAFGWATYVQTVLPTLPVNGRQAYFALLCLLTLLVVGHAFAQWLWRETALNFSPSPGTPGEASGIGDCPRAGRGGGLPREPNRATRPAWRFRWTLATTALILLTFTAGIAATGVAHQSAWLARSEDPMFISRFRRDTQATLDNLKCGSNLREIGQALYLYAQEHAGRLPDTLEELLTTQNLDPITQVCPASRECRNLTGTPTRADAIDPARHGHATYVYLARGQHYPTPTTRPLVCEPLTNHDLTGMNILFSDGTAQFFPPAEAQKILRTAGGQ
jgi:hypothetical protein